MEIICARTEAHLDEIRRLFREYETELGEDLCFQNFEAELAALPGKYQAPTGALLLATDGENAAGCVAMGKMDDWTCEMKRLYVRPEHRREGLGRRLALAVIQEARRIGYRTMRLDTLDRLTTALKLYESLGFEKTEPYYDNPLYGVVYLALDLTS